MYQNFLQFLKEKSRTTTVVKVFLVTFLISCGGLLQGQQVSQRAITQLQAAYNHIQHPEISFADFVRVNAHVFENSPTSSAVSSSSAASAQQDTYCSNLKTWCANGDFESGLDQTQWTGAYGFDYSGVTPNPFSLTYGYSSGALTDGNAHQTIVLKTSGNDPIVPTIPLVDTGGGTRSLRLGNAVTGNGTEVLAKTITVSSNETILKFKYAVVFQDPSHAYNDQPAFSVRVYDCSTGLELTGVCNLGNGSNVVVSDANNPFFQSYFNSSYGTIAYKSWSNSQIDLSAHIGKKVTIIFETKDCNLGGHFGYAYLDNINSSLCSIDAPVQTGQPDLRLDTVNTSTCGVGTICAKYQLPSSNQSTGTANITLSIYQAGALVTTLTSGVLSSGTSYCFNVNPASLGLNSGLGGFDFTLTGNFILTGFNLSPITVGNPPSGITSGVNNDYLIACQMIYYSKASGALHTLSTWGVNMDGSGTQPTDFGSGKTFVLANRSGVYTLTNDWTVGGLIVNNTGSQLQLNNFTLSEAGLSGGGTLTGTLTSSLIVTGSAGGDAGTLNFTPGSANLFRLTLNRTGTGASVSIGSQMLSLYNTFTITSGAFNTNNLLTLKSNAANTSRFNPLGGSITGSVMVERYIPARRAWRILCAPVTGTQTINAAWQEGAATTTANPAPNFGTFITGGTVANGFDQSPGAVSSMKTYSNTSGWVPIANTNATAVNAAAYMTFIYGNRNNVTIPTDQQPGNTTLRSFGPLKTGDQTFAVAATGFTAVPNPFASPINFATITRSGVTNTFYLWDPKIGGTNGVGGYVTVSFNGTSYDVSSNAISPESQFIQSGQGFLVYPSTSGTAGSVTIKESDKSNTAETDVFRTTAGSSSGGDGPVNVPVFQDPTKGQGLRMNLQVLNQDRTSDIVDEIFASYKPSYSNKVDMWDAVKATNMAENLGMVRGDVTLAIERKELPVEGDVIELKLWNTEAKNYVLEFNPINLSSTGLYAYLQDKYLKTTTPVSLSEKSKVTFNISSDAASARTDRFSIVFSKSSKLSALSPISQTKISVYPNPITGQKINFQFNDQPTGDYQVELLSTTGSVLLAKKIVHTGGSMVQSIQLDKKLPTGMYQIKVTGQGIKTAFQVLIQ